MDTTLATVTTDLVQSLALVLASATQASEAILRSKAIEVLVIEALEATAVSEVTEASEADSEAIEVLVEALEVALEAGVVTRQPSENINL